MLRRTAKKFKEDFPFPQTLDEWGNAWVECPQCKEKRKVCGFRQHLMRCKGVPKRMGQIDSLSFHEIKDLIDEGFKPEEVATKKDIPLTQILRIAKSKSYQDYL